MEIGLLMRTRLYALSSLGCIGCYVYMGGFEVRFLREPCPSAVCVSSYAGLSSLYVYIGVGRLLSSYCVSLPD